MPDLIQELTEDRAQVADLMDTMASADDFDPESRDWADLKVRGEHLDKRVSALREAAEHRSSAARLRDMLTRAPAAQGTVTRDVGEQLVRSEAWKTWLRNGGGGRAHLMDVELNRRAVLTSTWFPGQDSRIVADVPARSTPLLDVLSNVQVSSGSVEIVTYQSGAPLAGVVPEGSAKPEATITTAVTPVTLDTLAHWIEVTRQALEDEAMVRDLISGGLLRGVNDKAEALAAGVIQGGTYSTVAGSNMLESIRLGVAQVQTAGFNPNAVLINPADAATLDGIIWGLGSGFPTVTGGIFGLRIVPAAAITAGSAFVGDFNAGAKYLYTGAAQLYVSDSDVGIVAAAAVSNFKRNVITFLAEMRSKTVLVRTEAIVECTPAGGAITAEASKRSAGDSSKGR